MKKSLILVIILFIFILTSCSKEQIEDIEDFEQIEETIKHTNQIDDPNLELFVDKLNSFNHVLPDFLSYDNIVQSYGLFPINYSEPIIKKDYVKPTLKSTRPGTKRNEIKYIVIHDTGNNDFGANALKHSQYLHSNPGVSWHYCVDDDMIINNIPDIEHAFHAGDGLRKAVWYQNGRKNPGGGNYYGIGIEMCVDDGSDFYSTINNTAKLTAELMMSYNLTLDNIKTHYDFTGKNCPRTFREANYLNDFLSLVEIYHLRFNILSHYSIEFIVHEGISDTGVITTQKPKYELILKISYNQQLNYYNIVK